jgi:ribonuclease D
LFVNTIPPYRLLDRPDQLAPLFAALGRADEVAIDTEADNLFRYRTRICLLQLQVAGEIFLVDLLADLPLDPLWRRLEARHLIMHGSDYDLRLLGSFCRFAPQSLFDTMFAAQLLNSPKFGLGALLERYFGVKLSKSLQKANWSERPLTRNLLDYAALDVHYLPPLRDRLRDELARLGRLDWLTQKCQWQITSAGDGLAEPDGHGWRLGGSERLGDRGLCVLHAIWHWRETWAEHLDTPPFKVTGNDLLMRIAGAADAGQTLDTVLDVRLGRRHARLFPSLVDAVRRGLAADPQSLPRRERRREYDPLTRAEVVRQDRLKNARDRLAAQLNLDATLIATRAQLVQLARAPDSIDGVLLPWQAGLLRTELALHS